MCSQNISENIEETTIKLTGSILIVSYMDKELNKLLQDESEDAILARIQEESLRYFNEVELPRRAAEQKEEEKKKECTSKKWDHFEPQPHCSKATDYGVEAPTPTPTPTQTPATEVFYRAPGQGADGFHLAAGETYVYPTNYPVRQYQKSIIHSALFHNTLVSLPTGLGKTFIAAVVMYNFYRWFPQGKVVFMAPTRPLVAQQIRACHDIMAIPIRDTVEMTGAMNPTDRLQHWKTKRVFFLTPQVMANDLRTKACPPASGAAFKCVVIDEAHRATKEYSYCHVIKELESAKAIFRVVALSATPGSNIKAVVEVVQNLRIATLELRGEDSPDVTPYTHAKQVEPVALSLSKNITDFREHYLQLFERYVKSLRESRLITCNVQNLTKFQLLKASEKLRGRPPQGMNKARVGALMSDFTVCMTLAHGLELLQTYGLRAFHQYFTVGEDEENRKAAFTRLNSDADFHDLMDKLAKAVSSPMDQFWSHPKHEHLVKILKDHFCQAEKQGSDTKVIIFCQYRVVVSELYELLQSAHPLIKPVMFIGQGVGKDRSGLPQKKQIEVMKGFRQGLSNVLIATCVAEEGLDIGSVDLLVMMECQRSPVRLVQRLGRTGRHRQGRCVVLLTTGREVQKFNEAMATRKSFISMIQNSNVLKSSLIRDEPQMVPPHIMPKMQLVHINVPQRITPAKKKKQADIRQALTSKINDTEEKEPEESPFLNPDQLAEAVKELGSTEIKFDSLSSSKAEYLFHRINEPPMGSEELFSATFARQSEYNDWNRVLHQTYLVLHSGDTETLCHLLHKSEAMLLNTHTDVNSQQINSSSLFPKKKAKKSKAKNDSITKKKKCEKEERHGRDIRECMAQAAEKVRLTQNQCIGINEPEDQIKYTEEESFQACPDPVILEISDEVRRESAKETKNRSNEELRESNCMFCDKEYIFPFSSGCLMSKCNKLTDDFILNSNSLSKVESLVKNMTKEVIQNINVAKLFDANANIVSKMKNSLQQLKGKVNFDFCNKVKSPLISVDDIFDSEFSCPQSPVLDSNTINSQKIQEKELKHKIPGDQNENFFELQDLFDEDADDFCFQALEKNTKTSTPVKGNCPVINYVKNSIFMLPKSENIQKSVDQNEIKGIKDKFLIKNSEHTSPITNSNPMKPVFKIPQMKLSFAALSTPKSDRNVDHVNVSTPGSPILSGQITSEQNTHFSPILSGQVASDHNSLLSPILSGQVNANHNNNLSPISSGQITSTPKLERKVLFKEVCNKRGNDDNSELCNPLDSAIKHSETDLAEIDALNLLSASQLFDDSSGEEKKENLEQSSMYTISQLVAKVSSLADKLKNPQPEHKDSNLIKKETTPNKVQSAPTTHFGSSDEDSIFDQINLDNFSLVKESLGTKVQPNRTSDNSFKTTKCSSVPKSLLNDSAEIEKNEIEKINLLKKSFIPRSPSPEVPDKMFTQRYEKSFISSRWLTCMKTPLKTNKSVSFAAETKSFSMDSNSDSDVFEKSMHKTKTKSVTGVDRPRNKIGKSRKQQAGAGGFLEMEADVSLAGGVECSSDEENTSGLDELDESFINDRTELQSAVDPDLTAGDIHAKYLQSVKSPLKNPGFKIPAMTDSIMARDVYSQAVPEDSDSYENDSFCCDATEIHVEDEPSELEIAERLLKKKSRKGKKRKRKRHKPESSSGELSVSFSDRLKKKRLLSSSSSNEDVVSDIQHLTEKRKYLSSSDSSPNTINSKKIVKKQRRVQLLSSSDSDSDKTIL